MWRFALWVLFEFKIGEMVGPSLFTILSSFPPPHSPARGLYELHMGWGTHQEGILGESGCARGRGGERAKKRRKKREKKGGRGEKGGKEEKREGEK